MYFQILNISLVIRRGFVSINFILNWSIMFDDFHKNQVYWKNRFSFIQFILNNLYDFDMKSISLALHNYYFIILINIHYN
jgi:hypothetical protein